MVLANTTMEVGMARISKEAVLSEATAAARRVSFVGQDPAVVKAATQAGQDLAQATRSCAALATEIRGSWARSA